MDEVITPHTHTKKKNAFHAGGIMKETVTIIVTTIVTLEEYRIVTIVCIEQGKDITFQIFNKIEFIC